MFTRKQYINDKACTHDEYYSQFVDSGVIARVGRFIGVDKIKASTHSHFSNIPLPTWDAVMIPVPSHIADKLREAGDYPTLAGAVCIAKQAARHIRDGI